MSQFERNLVLQYMFEIICIANSYRVFITFTFVYTNIKWARIPTFLAAGANNYQSCHFSPALPWPLSTCVLVVKFNKCYAAQLLLRNIAALSDIMYILELTVMFTSADGSWYIIIHKSQMCHDTLRSDLWITELSSCNILFSLEEATCVIQGGGWLRFWATLSALHHFKFA